MARLIATEIATRSGRPPIISDDTVRRIFRGRNFYAFLWSLVKMAAAYDLKTVGGVDWYRWGAEIRVLNQARDGSWFGGQGLYGRTIDTCFTLLFLGKSNITKDLTSKLKGSVGDPGKAVLKPAPKPEEGPKEKEKPAG